MTAYASQSVETVSPISAASQVNVTQTSAAFALPSTSGALSPCLLLETLQGATISLFIKFGLVGVTVSMADGMKIAPGTPGKPAILGIPAGSTHVAIICDGAPCVVSLTGADALLSAFAPNGASSDVVVTATTQAVAIPTPGTGTAAIALVGLQSAQISWFVKFGNGAVTVSRTDGTKIPAAGPAAPVVLSVPAGATHFAIICEGPAGSVRVTGGTLSTGTAAGVITNAMLADMAQATIKGRAAGAGTGPPQDLTPAQATAILDIFTSLLKGLVPASGGNTAHFLCADGSFKTPPYPVPVTKVATEAHGGGTTYTRTGLGSFEFVQVFVGGLSHGGANGTLRVEFSGDSGASGWSTPVVLSATVAAAGLLDGAFSFSGAGNSTNCYVSSPGVSGNALGGVVSVPGMASGGNPDSYRLSWSSGASFDAGTINTVGFGG